MIIPMTPNMDCNALCKTIQKVIDRYNREVEHTVMGTHVLSINVVKLTDAGDDHIPKLENKE